MYVRVFMWHGLCVEIRGRFAQVCFFLPCVHQVSNSCFHAWRQDCHLQSHLAEPPIFIFRELNFLLLWHMLTILKINGFLKNSKTYHFVYFMSSLPYFVRVICLFLLNPSHFPCFSSRIFALLCFWRQGLTLYPGLAWKSLCRLHCQTCSQNVLFMGIQPDLSFQGRHLLPGHPGGFFPAHPTSFNSTCLSRFSRLLNSIRKKICCS